MEIGEKAGLGWADCWKFLQKRDSIVAGEVIFKGFCCCWNNKK